MSACLRQLLLASLITGSLAGQHPASFTSFGTGCSGQPRPPLLYATGLPFVGQPFTLVATGVQPASGGVLITGISDRQWAGHTLPLNLAIVGAPNCQLLVSADLALGFSTGNGVAMLTAILPNRPSLVGTTWYHQVLTPDATSNPAGWAMSNGGKAVLGQLPPSSITEDFTTDGKLDKEESGGTWGNGRAVAPLLGGTGELGAFDITAGRQDPAEPRRYVWSTDSQLIPGSMTPTGRPITVVGGVFHFSRLELATGFTLAFEGSSPAQLRVRGRCRIEGEIQVDAAPAPYFFASDAIGPTPTGQPGAPGNCGGGRGGQGGDSCGNLGPNPRFDGRPGEVVRLPAGNGYGTRAAVTSGKGSPQFPASGINSQYCALTGVFCGLMGVGGGGGGFATRGGDGFPVVVNGVHQNPCRLAANSGSAPNSGGGAFDLGGLTNTNQGPDKSLGFYAVGGSGGGGGGSHPLLTRQRPFDKWLPGSAGAGGGGVVALRVGQELTMAAGSAIRARGGKGYVIDGVLRANEPRDGLFNVPTPGGGGSGGSILLQVIAGATMNGLLDTSGGAGGVLDNTPTFQSGLLARSNGGDGSDGYYRLETPQGPSIGQIGNGIPSPTAKNGGVLADRELRTVAQSKFYDIGRDAPPVYLRYIVVATVGGQRRVYSDDASVGRVGSGQYDKDYAGLAAPSGPLHFQVQGARIDINTGRVLSTSPWRDYVASSTNPDLNRDGANGWRFSLGYDQSTSPVVVDSVTVWFQR